MKRNNLNTYNYSHNFRVKKKFDASKSEWISPLDDKFSGDGMIDYEGIDIGVSPQLSRISKRAVLINNKSDNFDL